MCLKLPHTHINEHICLLKAIQSYEITECLNLRQPGWHSECVLPARHISHVLSGCRRCCLAAVPTTFVQTSIPSPLALVLTLPTKYNDNYIVIIIINNEYKTEPASGDNQNPSFLSAHLSTYPALQLYSAFNPPDL